MDIKQRNVSIMKKLISSTILSKILTNKNYLKPLNKEKESKKED